MRFSLVYKSIIIVLPGYCSFTEYISQTSTLICRSRRTLRLTDSQRPIGGQSQPPSAKRRHAGRRFWYRTRGCRQCHGGSAGEAMGVSFVPTNKLPAAYAHIAIDIGTATGICWGSSFVHCASDTERTPRRVSYCGPRQ
jgi:hypothetical protein